VAEPEFVRALDRGLAVLQAFSAERPVLTVSDVAAATELTRATSRRFLYTLEQLEYVRSEARGYTLTPKVLSIGYPYISALGIGPVATPRIQALAAQIREAVTIGTLFDAMYVVVARAESDRIVTASVTIGTARPAHASSLGKVLLAALPEAELGAYLARDPLHRYTARTITSETAIRAELAAVRTQGWAVSEEELEDGLISVGAPLYRNHEVIAAINTTSHTGRSTLERMKTEVLPHLLTTATAISADLTRPS